MTVTTNPAFTLDAATGTSFGASSSSIALPGTQVGGTDTMVRAANLGPNTVSVSLSAGAGTVTTQNGVAVVPGDTLFLAITTSQDHLNGIAHGSLGMGSTVNVATGN